jgi:hypothetical protein
MLLTAMILSLEQLIYNDTNQNRMLINKKQGDTITSLESYIGFNRNAGSISHGHEKIKHLIEKTTDMT